ncbi:hypothetical protein SynBIOSE41_02070 [Synechococcus sp. BIOS-E4-1]|nr:hypothetical protein SynBIOSE41_02070 [Synechococcus sp. BIOS-E4-1]
MLQNPVLLELQSASSALDRPLNNDQANLDSSSDQPAPSSSVLMGTNIQSSSFWHPVFLVRHQTTMTQCSLNRDRLAPTSVGSTPQTAFASQRLLL